MFRTINRISVDVATAPLWSFSVTIGGPLQQERVKNQWKMKSFTDYNGVVATENVQKPMENE